MGKSAHGVLFLSGEVPVPILSVVSSGTRQPFRNRLSKLNHAIISTILREIVSPYWSRSSRKVSSRRVSLVDNSSVALHTRTYSGLIPDTGPSVAAASISVADSPAFLAITTLDCAGGAVGRGIRHGSLPVFEARTALYNPKSRHRAE